MADRIPDPVCIFSGSCGKNLYPGLWAQAPDPDGRFRESGEASCREREDEGKCESAAALKRKTAVAEDELKILKRMQIDRIKRLTVK
jgi:hypothetical protein